MADFEEEVEKLIQKQIENRPKPTTDEEWDIFNRVFWNSPDQVTVTDKDGNVKEPPTKKEEK